MLVGCNEKCIFNTFPIAVVKNYFERISVGFVLM